MGYVKARLNQAAISDIHLGNDNVPTQDICDRLRQAFPANKRLAELDIIWIPGDVFDRLHMASSNDIAVAKIWICDFLRACKACNVRVRVMEGTPLHDRGQARMFETLNISAQIEADVRYIPKLSIEYMEDWGIHVLYVPDQHRPDPEDTWLDVQSLLASHGLKQVDYALMHGCFEYQLPKQMAHITHKSERYLSIVRRWIFNGHHHTHTRFDRIIVQGSFDRLKSGEEEAKGYVRVYEDLSLPATEAKIEFCENKDATPFKRFILDPTDCQDTTAIQTLIDTIEALDPRVRVTVKYHAAHHHHAVAQLRALSRAGTHRINLQDIKPKGSAVQPSGELVTYAGARLTFADICDGLKQQMDVDGIDPERQATLLKALEDMHGESCTG